MSVTGSEITSQADASLHLVLEPLVSSRTARLERRLAPGRGIVSVGRAGRDNSTSDLQLSNSLASRRHCVIQSELEAGQLRMAVIDSSSNGTFVNGARVQTKQFLCSGDELTLSQQSGALEDPEVRPCGWTVMFWQDGCLEAHEVPVPDTDSEDDLQGELLAKPNSRGPIKFVVRNNTQGRSNFKHGQIDGDANSMEATRCATNSIHSGAASEAQTYLRRLSFHEEGTGRFGEWHSGDFDSTRDVSQVATELSRLDLSSAPAVGQVVAEPAPEPAPEPTPATPVAGKHFLSTLCTDDRQSAQFAVLDTNQLLESLDAVQYIVAHLPGVNFVVPQIVLRELEGLQHATGSSSPGSERALAARHALRYMQSTLLGLRGHRAREGGEPSALVLQELGEEVQPRRSGLVPNADDDVLACALHFEEVVAPGLTEVLTADKGLAIKAAARGIPSECAAALMSRGARVLAACRAAYAMGPNGSPEERRHILLSSHESARSRQADVRPRCRQ